MRACEIRPWPTSCLPKSRMFVLTISESVPALSASAAASGPSAAKPWPHGPVAGFTGGHARSSATAVKSLSMKPSKPQRCLSTRVSS